MTNKMTHLRRTETNIARVSVRYFSTYSAAAIESDFANGSGVYIDPFAVQSLTITETRTIRYTPKKGNEND